MFPNARPTSFLPDRIEMEFRFDKQSFAERNVLGHLKHQAVSIQIIRFPKSCTDFIDKEVAAKPGTHIDDR